MPTSCRPLVFRLSLLAAGLYCLAGCEEGGHFTLLGYTTRPPFNLDIKTVYIPIPKNESYAKYLEFDLHKAVQRELAKSPYRLTSNRGRADTELVMKIVNKRKDSIIINQLGEARDLEVGVTIEVVWRDLRPGHTGDILSNQKKYDPNEKPLPGQMPDKAPKEVPVMVTPTATYAPELAGSNAMAQQQALNQAAVKIIQMMEVWPK